MRIGYPCINRTIGCTANSTFRLRSYSRERLIETVANNLACLEKILAYNLENDLLFFRISSDLVPFGSHPVNTFDWPGHFAADFRRIGVFIKRHRMRISMHPDQFVVLNSMNPAVLSKSIEDLRYHCRVLDALGLGRDAKVQLHAGGVYGDRESAIARLVATIKGLSHDMRKRLVIENDNRCYPLRDCLAIHRQTGVPILFDFFHHACLHCGEPMEEALAAAARTWKPRDGAPMVDYSQQQKGARTGTHTQSLSARGFAQVVRLCERYNCDVMLEIKDKESSALRGWAIMRRELGNPK
jgi:UV DNA damage endonuclease